MNLQNRLRLDAALAAEEGQPLDDFVSRQEVSRSRGRWPRRHTVRSFTPPQVGGVIRRELWPDF